MLVGTLLGYQQPTRIQQNNHPFPLTIVSPLAHLDIFTNYQACSFTPLFFMVNNRDPPEEDEIQYTHRRNSSTHQIIDQHWTFKQIKA